MNNMFYYTDESGDVADPVPKETIQMLFRAGLVSSSSQVCREGSDKWCPVSTVLEAKARSDFARYPEKSIPAREDFQQPTGPSRSAAQVNREFSKSPPVSPPKAPSSITPWVISFAILVGAFLGNVHLITGSEIEGFRLVRKGSFGFSETFINVDMITGMPWLAAQTRFPIGCRILQREEIIESEANMKSRTQREILNKFEESQREILRLMRRSQ